MTRPLIVIGDKTSHGGTVISADMTCDIHGKYMARVGDLTVCPKCKGTFPITSGPADLSNGAGQAYARHLDATACGAKLLSGQVTTYWGPQSSMGAGAAADASAAQASPAAVAAQTPTLCLECLVAAAARGDSIVPRG